MYAKADLYLLRDAIGRLTETPYFNKHLGKYSKGITQAVQHVVDASPPYDEATVRFFSKCVWAAHKYLRGSISREIPYELAYALEFAVKEWTKKECVITMSLGADKDFHFFPSDVWDIIKKILPNFAYPDFDALLIQVAVPRIYRDRPIFNIPLYHELGHFIDKLYSITEYSFLILDYATLDKQQEESHRSELFADAFAAQYVGDANIKVLEAFIGSASASKTHPSSYDRRQITEDFLAAKSTPLLDAFNSALAKQGAPNLQPRATRPALASAYDNMCPFNISDERELHGIFGSSWNYLESALGKTHPTWSSLDEATIERVINDLTEKSIRNMSIKEKWKNGTAP